MKPAARGRLFIPKVIPEFQKQYPHVAVDHLLQKQGVKIQSPIVVSNFDILLDLCLSGNYGTICLMSNIGRLLHKENSGRHQQVRAFAVKDGGISLAVELLTRSQEKRLHYREQLIEMLKDAVLCENDRVSRWVAEQR